jgi:hypothetical protein
VIQELKNEAYLGKQEEDYLLERFNTTIRYPHPTPQKNLTISPNRPHLPQPQQPQAIAIDYTYKDSIEPSESNEDKKSLSYTRIKNRLDEITSKNSQESLSSHQKARLLNFYGSFDNVLVNPPTAPQRPPEISPNSYDFKKISNKLNTMKGCSVNYKRDDVGSSGDNEKLDFFATHERISGYMNEIFNRYV